MILPIHKNVRERLRVVLNKLYNLNIASLPSIAIEYPPKRELGDLAITVAFELARTLRKSPRVIAQEIVTAIGQIEGIHKIETTSNGYINMYINRLDHLRYGLENKYDLSVTPNTVKTIVEHTAINPNKAAHIGHLRNAALGDTLVRLLKFQGLPVETQNYIDDTGVQVADVVVGFRELETKTLDEIRHLANSCRFDHYCWDLYAQVTEWYENDPTRLKVRVRTLHEIEVGDNEASEMAQFVAEKIVRCHIATMARLNVDYDLLSWEGDILRLDFWKTAFDLLKLSGAISLQTTGEKAGCWTMPIDENPSINGEPASKSVLINSQTSNDLKTKVIIRSDGTVTYVGKDIAYQFWKFGLLGRNFNFRFYDNQRSGRPLWTTCTKTPQPTTDTPMPNFGNASNVYNVIDTRQSYLQKLLQQALKETGHPDKAEHSIHFSYEMVALSHNTAKVLGYKLDQKSDRPFVEVSGRKGLGVKADDLLDRVTGAAKKEVVSRNPELDNTDADNVAKIIATAAVRYFMIKFSRGRVIVFDIDEALSFEGESGPYIQYAAVRATNILQKLQAKDGTNPKLLPVTLRNLQTGAMDDPDETELWALVLEASRLDEVTRQAVRTLELSSLAKYAFSLAQAFNACYHRFPVVKEKRRHVRLSRAAAVSYFRMQLGQALELMGCQVPPLM